jgi:GDP-L-fucose synthase
MENKMLTYVAGHTGLVGSALYRRLGRDAKRALLTADFAELDLRRQADTEKFFEKHRPQQVFLAAARVGGILANSTYKAEFIYDNLAIALNVVNTAYSSGVKKLLNLGSSCIYPKLAPQPITEAALLTSALEPTNEPYAVAKISALKLCRYYNEQYGTNYISGMPTNLYGPGDNYSLETGHVVPAMLRKFHLAKLVSVGDYDGIAQDFGRCPVGFGLDEKLKSADKAELAAALKGMGIEPGVIKMWGTGEVFREFLFVEDLAEACAYLMDNCDARDIGEIVNIGTGEDIKLKDLALQIKAVTGYEGKIVYDASKPDGTPRKLLNVDKIKALGWRPAVGLSDGIGRAYKAYCELPQPAGRKA